MGARPSSLVACVLLGGACAERVPLPQVPVTGGTEQQQDEVRRILAEFEDATGEDRVLLTEVSFEPIYGEALGMFGAVTDRVRVEPELEGLALERVLRHELCHALDYGEGRMKGPDPTFDALVRDLFHVGAVDTDGLGGPRLRRGEAFARYCDLGPLVAHALSSACPGEPAEVSDAARYLTRRVWRTWEPPRSHSAPGVAHASWTAPALDPDAFAVVGLTDPSAIRVRYGAATVDLGLDDGVPLDDRALGVFAPQEDLPEGLADLCPYFGSDPEGVGWSEGPAAAVVRFDVYDDASAARIVATEGGAWGLVEGCAPQQAADLFATADHRLWLAWVDGFTVSWAPLLE